MLIDLSHPRWDSFFLDVCAIEATGEASTNDLGELTREPQPLEGHDAVQCQFIEKAGKVVSATGQIIEVSTVEIGLRGYFPAIKAGMSAITRGTRYKVLSAPSDSQRVKTRLIVEAIQ